MHRMDIRLSQEPHLRIAYIVPPDRPTGVTVFLPFPDGRPLLVEGRLRLVSHPESYGPWSTMHEWRLWVESFAARRNVA